MGIPAGSCPSRETCLGHQESFNARLNHEPTGNLMPRLALVAVLFATALFLLVFVIFLAAFLVIFGLRRRRAGGGGFGMLLVLWRGGAGRRGCAGRSRF